MSRILLIATNRATSPYVVYPLGMAVVAGALTAAGHEIEQFDLLATETEPPKIKQAKNEQTGTKAPNPHNPLTAIIKNFAPEFIGLSLRNIDNTDSFSGVAGWYLEAARQTVKEIRTLTAVPLIVGGPAFSLMPEAILDYLQADYGIIGEGEEALPRLIKQLNAGKTPPALHKGIRPLNGDEFASPRFHAEILDFYQSRSGMANLQSKRGCPHRCAYCTYPELEGRRFRHRPPAAVVDDLERLKKDHKIEKFFFVDSVFNDDEGHHLAIAEEILKRALKLQWSAFFRPRSLGLKELKLMQQAGLLALELGSDALTAKTLAGLSKGFTFDDICTTHENCLKLKLPTAHYLIFGGPDETPATLAEGLSHLDRLAGSVLFLFSGLRLLPGTRLYQRALQEKVITATTSLLRPTYYFSPEIDPESMNREIAQACRGHRERLFPPAEALERLKIMQRFGFKGLLWDQLLKHS
ncbi:MAG: cobalamin-dependent protein [Deltaproteobacteria bacterium]|nr:cobalamin-dependent protein [Deltaproteobacteria bacterium]